MFTQPWFNKHLKNNPKDLEPVEITPPRTDYNWRENVNKITDAFAMGIHPTKYLAISLDGIVTTAEPSYWSASQLLRKKSIKWCNDGFVKDESTGWFYVDPYAPCFNCSQYAIVNTLRDKLGKIRNFCEVRLVSKDY